MLNETKDISASQLVDLIDLEGVTTVLLVMGPNCPACHSALASLRQSLQHHPSLTMLGTVNSGIDPHLCEMMKVSSVPTAIFFRSGTMRRYVVGAKSASYYGLTLTEIQDENGGPSYTETAALALAQNQPR